MGLEYVTGFSTRTWDWNLGLEQGSCYEMPLSGRTDWSQDYIFTLLNLLLKHLSSSLFRSKVMCMID